MSPFGRAKPVSEWSDYWLRQQRVWAKRRIESNFASDDEKATSEVQLREFEAEIARRAAAAALLPKPPLSCSCAEWEPSIKKLDAPIITAQARNPHLTSAPEFQFTAFRFCPWCGKKLRASAPRENRA